MSWSHEQVITLIDLYKSKDILYNVKSIKHKNKHARYAAWNEIFISLKEIRPSTSIDEIKSKINGLRTNFLAEYRKIKKSQLSGSGTDEIYEPNLWYFNHLVFILDHTTPRTARDTIVENALDETSNNTEVVHSDIYIEGVSLQLPDDEILLEISDVKQNSSVISETQKVMGSSDNVDFLNDQIYVPVSKKKKKKNECNEDEVIKTASRAVNKIAEVLQNNVENEKDNIKIFCDFVESRIRMLENDNTKNEAMKKITNILFELH